MFITLDLRHMLSVLQLFTLVLTRNSFFPFGTSEWDAGCNKTYLFSVIPMPLVTGA